MIVLRKKTGIILLLVHLALGAGGCVVHISDVHGDADWDSDKAEASASFSRTVPVQGESAIHLSGTNGAVTVRGEAGIQSAIIHAKRWVRAHTRTEAEDHLPLLHVSVEVNGEVIGVKTEQPETSGGRTYGVDYEITVPSTFFVKIRNGNGGVEVLDLREDLWVESGNGDLVVLDHQGSSWVSLGNGEIRCDLVLPNGGQVVHAVGNGGVKLTVQESVSAGSADHVGNGVIGVTGLDFIQWSSGPLFAEGVLGTGDGLIDLSVGNGWIQVQGQ